MKQLNTIRVFTGIVVSILLGVLLVHAQLTEGSIVGTVTDPSGAAIPGARVVVTSKETGQVQEYATNEIGYYRAPLLRPGRYTVQVEASGFSTAKVEDVEVNVNVVTRTDVQLQVGAMAETIIVTEGTRLVQTEEAHLKDTITTRQITELPLNGREVYQLMNLQPGVTATAAPVISNVPSPTAPVTFDFGFSANGATPRANSFLLDGTSNNNEWLGGTPLIFPSVDAIEEFQVQTLNYSAAYGRTNGGIVNVVTKSGTNDLHGAAFYFHRNTALNARNFFDFIDKTPLQHHQFGFALGGPIVKSKTFFFVNYEGSRRKDGQPERATAETPEFRDQVFALPFAPAGMIAAQFLQDFPAPPCIPGTEEDRGAIPDPALGTFGFAADPDPVNPTPDICATVASQIQDHRADQYIVRVDHNFAESDRLFVRWVANDAFADVSRQELINANMRGFRSPLDGFFADLHAGYTHLFSPSLINDFHFAFARNDSQIFFEVPSSTSLDMLEAAGTPDFFAHLSFDDGVIPFGGAIYIPRDFVFNTWTIADTLSQIVGRHSLRYGFELRYIQEDSNYELETRPFYEFNSIFNFANDQPWLVEALVNRECPGPDCGNFQDTPRRFRWTQWAAFVQDDWKVLPNLTLNLGLRYEVFGRPTETEGRLSNVTLGSGSTFAEQLTNATVGRVDHLFDVDRTNFAPRLGIAWDPTGSGKTVIRSGFSLAYIESYSNLHTNASRFDPPDATFIDICPVCGWGTGVDYDFPFQSDTENANAVTANGGAVGVSIFPSATREDLRTAYSVQWFLGVQKEFLRDYAFSINYVGTHGVSLYIREDWNRFAGDFLDFVEDRLTPGWGGGLYASNGDGSNYHGVNAQVRKNYSHGFMFVANYTFGKALDIVTEGGLGDYFNVNDYGLASYQGAADVANRHLDYGPSEFDVRHRFTLTSLWDLPSPTSDSAAVRKLLGGWQVNSIISLQSARPFDVYCTLLWFQGCDFNLDGLEKDRPNRPAGVQTGGFGNQDFVDGVFGPSQLDGARTFCPEASLIIGNPGTANEFLIGYNPFYLGTTCVPAGQNGTLSRNAFRGPGLYSVDLAIFKNTDITERVKVQFRAEFFNLFNRVNLYNPVGNMASSNFGRSLAAFAPRQIQLGLKFIF